MTIEGSPHAVARSHCAGDRSIRFEFNFSFVCFFLQRVLVIIISIVGVCNCLFALFVYVCVCWVVCDEGKRDRFFFSWFGTGI